MSRRPPPDFRLIWDTARANIEVLNGCTRPHTFKRIDDGVQMFGGKYRCDHCHGVVDSLAQQWYVLGLAHGRPAKRTTPCLGCDDLLDLDAWHEQDGICRSCRERTDAGGRLQSSVIEYGK